MNGPRWTPTFVQADGLRLRVGRRGEGRPLLLITGIGANLDMWGPFERLLDDREVIAFDSPGSGDSQRPPRPMRMAALARVAVALLDELGLDEVDALGYSFGGALAQELARQAPGRVRKLIICASAPGLGGLPPRPYPALLLATPARYYHEGLMRAIVPRIAGGRTARDPDQLGRQAAARLARPPDVLGYAYQLYAVAGWSSLPWLHRVTQPTLIVIGDDDPVIPVSNARLMAWRMPDARVRVVKGGGHLLLIDEPESVAADIQAFLDE